MDRTAFVTWIEALGRAWEARDPAAAAALFAEDATYQENPFDPPLRGRAAILEYWADVPRTQDDIHFSYEIIAVADPVAVVHWSVTLRRIPTGAPVRLDGVSVGTFDAHHRCVSWREWWHRQEETATGNGGGGF